MSATHYIVTFGNDPTWHLQSAHDTGTECGAGKDRIVHAVQPLDAETYDPGEAVLMSLVLDAKICEDCCEVINLRETLAESSADAIWDEMLRVDG